MKFSNVDIFVGIMFGMPESLDVCQLFSIDFHGTKAAKVQVICLKWFVGKAANALMLSLSLLSCAVRKDSRHLWMNRGRSKDLSFVIQPELP